MFFAAGQFGVFIPSRWFLVSFPNKVLVSKTIAREAQLHLVSCETQPSIYLSIRSREAVYDEVGGYRRLVAVDHRLLVVERAYRWSAWVGVGAGGGLRRGAALWMAAAPRLNQSVCLSV